jgi:putative membrane protein
MNATQSFTNDEVRQIEAAVADAESGTSGEIVCAVATESARYDRAESIVGLITSLVALGAAHLLHGALVTGPDSWSVAGLGIGWQALAVVLGFVGGSILASYVHPLRHLFVATREVDDEVHQAAWHVFGTAAIRGTVRGTGLLVYISLCERRVVILADQQAAEALGENQITALRDEAVERLRTATIAEACIATITAAGTALAEKVPADDTDEENELANHLLLFHPRPGSAG